MRFYSLVSFQKVFKGNHVESCRTFETFSIHFLMRGVVLSTSKRRYRNLQYVKMLAKTKKGFCVQVLLALIVIIACKILQVIAPPIPPDIEDNIYWVPTKVHLKASKSSLSTLKCTAKNYSMSFDDEKYHTTNSIGTDTSVSSCLSFKTVFLPLIMYFLLTFRT